MQDACATDMQADRMIREAQTHREADQREVARRRARNDLSGAIERAKYKVGGRHFWRQALTQFRPKLDPRPRKPGIPEKVEVGDGPTLV